MQANLTRVFGEHDAEQRMRAIRELYAVDALLNEPQASARGHAAINDAVTELLDSLPAEFVFRALGPALGHNGIGCLKWEAGPPDGPAVATGLDVAIFQGNQIQSLTVFLSPGEE